MDGVAELHHCYDASTPARCDCDRFVASRTEGVVEHVVNRSIAALGACLLRDSLNHVDVVVANSRRAAGGDCYEQHAIVPRGGLEVVSDRRRVRVDRGTTGRADERDWKALLAAGGTIAISDRAGRCGAGIPAALAMLDGAEAHGARTLGVAQIRAQVVLTTHRAAAALTSRRVYVELSASAANDVATSAMLLIGADIRLTTIGGNAVAASVV